MMRFESGGSFQADLNERVRAYFEGSDRSRRGGARMAFKAAVIVAWLIGSYLALMFAHPGTLLAGLLAVSIGLAMAGVGFCVMHDANHGATSSRGTVNALFGFSLDLLGASSVLWRHKHNVLHHTYTNVSGSDPDLEGGAPWLRLAPWQRLRSWHRFQHLYVWLLYAVFPLKWWFVDDVRLLAKGAVRGRALWTTLAGKVFFVGWAFALPLALHPSWALVAIWALAIATLGNVLAAVFQLAHCVDEVDFVNPAAAGGCWAQHQVATTMDFAPANPLLSWYLGGLNFQVEHHLFARVCHVHYRALAGIVRQTCSDHALQYRCAPTLGGALRANVRWLRRMGLPPAVPAAAAVAA
jgi:linoleoyl-CoA desaturase